jgi:hypothetical protein
VHIFPAFYSICRKEVYQVNQNNNKFHKQQLNGLHKS